MEAMINAEVLEAFGKQTVVGGPTVRVNRSPGKNPLLNKRHKSLSVTETRVGIESRFINLPKINRHHENSATSPLVSAKNPRSLDIMPAVVLSLSKFALINLRDLPFSAQFFIIRNKGIKQDLNRNNFDFRTNEKS